MPLLDRVHLAADAGFDGVDIPFPYDLPAKELQRALLARGMQLVSVATPPPNYTGGPRGYLASPGGGQRVAHDLRRALRFADALRVPLVQVLTGPDTQEAPREVDERILDNLRRAVVAPGTARLLLAADAETALPDLQRATDIVAGIDDPRVRLLLDARVLFDSASRCDATVRSVLPWTEVVAVTGPQGRERPDVKDDKIAALFDTLDVAGFDGWISAAYAHGAKDPGVLEWYTARNGDR